MNIISKNLRDSFIQDIGQHFKEFEIRNAQLRFLEEINLFLSSKKGVALIEGPTGTGKTVAYIYALLCNNRRFVISTKTKILQDQIVNSDLKILAKIFRIKSTILKGRNSYVCLQKAYDLIPADGDSHLRQWLNITETGLLEELQETPPLKNLITSNSRTCLKTRCPMKNACFYYRQREQIRDCNVLIVNHALLTRMLVHEPEFFNGFDTLVCDEAFQIDRIFIENSGVTVNKDILLSDLNYLIAFLQNDNRPERLLKAVLRLFDRKEPLNIDVILEAKNVLESIKKDRKMIRKNFDFKSTYEKFKSTTGSLEDTLEVLLNTAQHNNEYVVISDSNQINIIPERVPDLVRQRLFTTFEKIIFISATLFASRDHRIPPEFLFVPSNSIRCVAIDGGYDYKKQIAFFVVSGMASSENDVYVPDAFKIARLIKYVFEKRPDSVVLVLFTSWNILKQTAIFYRSLQPLWESHLLVQGEVESSTIVNTMSSRTGLVVFGNQSFWEGIDVPEDRITDLVITRLPFEYPEDWYLNLKCRTVRSAGKDPFNEVVLPQAVLTFRQGIGRLIRSQNKKGRLILCDDRIIKKRYGRYFLVWLPEPRIIEFTGVCS